MRALLATFAVLLAAAAAAPPATAIPAGARITTAGLGAVRIGMTERQVERAAGRSLRLTGGCSAAPLDRGVLGLFTRRVLARVYVRTRRYATRSGARVGDSEARVRRIYGDRLVREPHKYVEGGSYLKIVDGTRKVVFETDGKRVREISTGRMPEIDYVERCG